MTFARSLATDSNTCAIFSFFDHLGRLARFQRRLYVTFDDAAVRAGALQLHVAAVAFPVDDLAKQQDALQQKTQKAMADMEKKAASPIVSRRSRALSSNPSARYTAGNPKAIPIAT